MATLSFDGNIYFDMGDFERGFENFHVVEHGGETYLVGVSASGKGLTTYKVEEGGTAELVSMSSIPNSLSGYFADDAMLIYRNGSPMIAAYNADEDEWYGYSLNEDGSFGSLKRSDNDPDWVEAASFLYDANGTTIEIGYGDDSNEWQTASFEVATSTTSADPFFSSLFDLGDGQAVVYISPVTNEINVQILNSDGTFSHSGLTGSAQGLGINSPVAVEVVELDGSTYIVVGSNYGTISVLEVSPSGSLTVADHVLDTTETAFGGLTDLETIEINGQVYIIAGGADGGVSIFNLSEDGRLALVETLHDSTGNTFDGIENIEVVAVGDEIQIFFDTSGSDGLQQFTFDTSSVGYSYTASSSGGTVTGSSKNDVIHGGEGDDLLQGGNGDDIIWDGAGADQLWGGAGADLFVLSPDGEDDTVYDFEAGVDRFDVSNYRMLYSLGAIDVVSTSFGAIITVRGDVTYVYSDDGYSLTATDLFGSDIADADRPLELSYLFLSGTNSNDLITGSDDREQIYGMDGDDTINGGAGDDQIIGGDGRDTLNGGDGQDIIEGGLDRDLILAGDGNDVVSGGRGIDRVYLGGGNDTFEDDSQSGENGSDFVDGGQGDDWIGMSGGDDEVVGGDGDDTIFGGDGRDKLNGNNDDDTIHGGSDRDLIYGGDGNDTVEGGLGVDRIYLGGGADTYYDEAQGGSGGADVIYGGGGNDTIYGVAGNDYINGGSGSDTIYAGDGNNTVLGGSGGDKTYLQRGDDTYSEESNDSGVDRVLGGRGKDTIFTGDGDDYIDGEIGNDTLSGGLGNDTIFGGEGWDHIDAGSGNDTVYGGDGADTVLLGNGDDTFYDESQTGSNGKDFVSAGGGNDLIKGGGGGDTFDGGAGDDKIWGGADNDFLKGGSGSDAFIFSHGDDYDRILDFSVGEDLLRFVGTVDSMADLVVSQHADGIRFAYSGGAVILEGISMSNLGNIDIEFV